MSETAQKVFHKFLVYAPDKRDEGALGRRLSVRDQHVVVTRQNIASGFIRVASALITPESLDQEQKKMVGSVFICEAENAEKVREMIEADIYYTSDVWDPEKIVILGMLPATPLP
ncbi:hypothetical protein AMATHDRAFT_141095 [Amanita thiersii Skay4041]|uniref:YCII-related domain-containing protein n=1 Tax=Amanita thiersii Skay4041 TaxID=703135 RepID=A0A2A9NWH6_9AGAR|nr:hypothetical protein AMATHDRAFT_141095 [Amanita thiersii Skay4041]